MSENSNHGQVPIPSPEEVEYRSQPDSRFDRQRRARRCRSSPGLGPIHVNCTGLVHVSRSVALGHRLSKIYTRTGDAGTTGLADGSRVEKDGLRVHAMGDVDELNSLVGAVLVHPMAESIRGCLTDIQHALFDIGGELAIPGTTVVDDHYVTTLEQRLDGFNESLPPLKEFILPGGGAAAVACHVARSVCRRAERRMVELGRAEPVNEAARRYLNRLSDLLFVIARVLARTDGGEVFWGEGPESNRDFVNKSG